MDHQNAPTTLKEMRAYLKNHSRPLSEFVPGTVIKGAGIMALNLAYEYVLSVMPGTNFAPTFKPELTPGEMLAAGIFEGKYLNDCMAEFPREYYEEALKHSKLSPSKANPKVNYISGPSSRLFLYEWRSNGWLPMSARPIGKTRRRGGVRMLHMRKILMDIQQNPDERGWFQWYARYWLGRRIPTLDAVQISRWCSIGKQWRADGKPREMAQEMLQWAYKPD